MRIPIHFGVRFHGTPSESFPRIAVFSPFCSQLFSLLTISLMISILMHPAKMTIVTVLFRLNREILVSLLLFHYFKDNFLYFRNTLFISSVIKR